MKKVQTLTDRIVDYASYIDADRKAQDISYEAHLRELSAIQQVIEDKLLQESQARKQSEEQLIQLIEDKFKRMLTTEVSKESRVRYEQVEQLKNCLENDFPKVQEMLKSEQQ